MATSPDKAQAKPKTREVAGLRITTDVNRRIACAGHYWAGISEVPAADYTEAQIAELRECKLLDVKDVKLQVLDEGQAPA